jgi:hypothetical protein
VGVREQLAEIAEFRCRSLPVIQANARDPVKDRDGASSDILAADMRFMGIADFILKCDVASFQRHLRDVALIRISHFARRSTGEPIAGSLLTMLCYKEVYDAVAAGDIAVATSLASQMGGRDELERIHDHPFDYAMGYTIRALVLDQQNDARTWNARLAAECDGSQGRDFGGYPQFFNALLARDLAAANAALGRVVEGHRRQSKGRGVFKGKLDELLCVWGIGVANLARARGLAVDGEPPLIPNELLLRNR